MTGDQPADSVPAAGADHRKAVVPADFGRLARPRSPRGELCVTGTVLLALAAVGFFRGIGALAAVVGFACVLAFVAVLVRTLTITRAAANAISGRLDRPVPAPSWSVSVLAACHNEEAVVVRLLDSLTRLDYPGGGFELIVIDDGSTDATLELLRAREATEPRLRVLRRPPGEPGGKSGALNEALRAASGDVVVVYDADHAPDPSALRHLAGAFDDPAVMAAQGRCVIANPGDSLVAKLVAVDYLGGFVVHERGRHEYAGLPSYGGSNCAVRRAKLLELGGWNEFSVTEDTDLTLRIVLDGGEVAYVADALDYEEAVVSVAAYWKQRHRWALGHQQVARDFMMPMLRSPHLTRWRKFELFVYLLQYHLPVLAAAGFAAALTVSFLLPPGISRVAVGLAPLLVFGPMIQFGTALMLSTGSRGGIRFLPLYLPLFVLGMVLTCKAWFDGVTGRSYTWAKTARAGDDERTGSETREVSTRSAGPPPEHLESPAETREEAAPAGDRAAPDRPSADAGRFLATTCAVLAAALAGYLPAERMVRAGETWIGGRVAVLLAPEFDGRPFGELMVITRVSGHELALYTDLACSGAPVVAMTVVAAWNVRKVLRAKALAAGVLAAWLVMFLGNSARIAILYLAARFSSFDRLAQVHDSVAGAAGTASVLAALMAMFAVFAKGTTVQVAGSAASREGGQP